VGAKRPRSLESDSERPAPAMLIFDEVAYIPFDPEAAAVTDDLVAWAEILVDPVAVEAMVDRIVNVRVAAWWTARPNADRSASRSVGSVRASSSGVLLECLEEGEAVHTSSGQVHSTGPLHSGPRPDVQPQSAIRDKRSSPAGQVSSSSSSRARASNAAGTNTYTGPVG
jgi:hypothetical protein